MHVFNEGFNGEFWDFLIGKFIYGVFVYSPSHSNCDGNEGVGFPSIVLYGVN